MKAENIFNSIPYNLDQEVFDLLIQSRHVKIERIVSKGHTSPKDRWYDQDQNEWVIILKGEAIIVFETGNEVFLTEGGHLHIPAHTKHQVKWTTSKTETIWLAVHYDVET